MKQKRLAPILAVTLSLEMMVSPIVYAQSKDSTASKINNTAQTISSAINAAGAVWNASRNNLPMMNALNLPPQTVADLQQLKQQQTPQPDKYFNNQKLLQIPGLTNYLALNRINPAMLDCKTLPTTVHDFQPEVCRIGIMQDTGIATNVQMNQMQAYHTEYFQISKMYQNFAADSNSDGQVFGVGCMNNAMNILNGFFKYRLDELDKLTTNLESMQNQFREASRSDLDAIEEAVAVLEGDSEIANKVRSKRPDLFDFAKRFNNPACNSMFAGEALNDLGRSNGLNSINRNVKDLLTTKDGRYSGESYAQSHAAVVEDINSVVDKISKQVELNFNTKGSDPKEYNDFLKSVPGLVSSSSGIQDSIRLDSFADLQNKYTEQFAKLSEDRSLIASELPGSEAALSKLGALNASTFEAEVNSLETGIKNSCLANTIGSTQELVKKLYDPAKSSHAEKFGSSFLKDKIPEILNNPRTSFETKLAELQAAEKQANNRYFLKMENSYQVQTLDANGNKVNKVIGANARRSPSVYLSDVIQNCEAQFKANKLNNKLTGASAIQKLRTLGQQYKAFAKTQAAEAKKELRKKLVECTSPEIANNTVPGSCSPQLFNTRSPGFCANAAFSCSKNMQACGKQAEAYTKEIRDQKTARVNNYKTLLEKNKMDIVKMFDTTLAQYMKEGDMLRGMFGAGFSSPKGIQREVPEGQRYLDSFMQATGKQGSPDGKLLLENPDEYMKMFAANIENLKKSVQEQQDQILGGNSVNSKKDGLLASHIEKTKQNYKTVQSQSEKMSNQCRSAYDSVAQESEKFRKKQQEDMMKKTTELGEKRQKFCNLYQSAQKSDQPACEEVNNTFIQDSLNAASTVRPDLQAQARNEVSSLVAYCSRNGGLAKSETGMDAAQICLRKDQAPKTLPGGPEKYEKVCAERKEKCTAKLVPNENPDRSHSVFQMNPECEDAKEEVVAVYQLFKSTPEDSELLALEDAPAYCSAGDNSNRSTGKENPFDAFTRQMLGNSGRGY